MNWKVTRTAIPLICGAQKTLLERITNHSYKKGMGKISQQLPCRNNSNRWLEATLSLSLGQMKTLFRPFLVQRTNFPRWRTQLQTASSKSYPKLYINVISYLVRRIQMCSFRERRIGVMRYLTTNNTFATFVQTIHQFWCKRQFFKLFRNEEVAQKCNC